jgi:hypothetical protein
MAAALNISSALASLANEWRRRKESQPSMTEMNEMKINHHRQRMSAAAGE